ncbi:MAG: CheB methylesterase domain-containing protein [Defluviitaleaceae bacterium]|nr:CheB methylesterase domain-containing protein [Defluviitaleaceae bacterium]
MFGGLGKIIAIGASTGGVEALGQLLSGLPDSAPPVLLVIHMQAGMTRLFANHLDGDIKLSVKEAVDGDVLKKGQVFIAPSGKHMRVISRNGQQVFVECKAGAKVQSCIPSADVLFDSVADVFKQNAIGVILTGVGADGARGLLRMREKGASTIGQDEQSSAVYGMPKVAMEMGAVQHQLPLNRIANKILSLT